MPNLWDHNPGSALKFRAGGKVADIDTDGTPGFTGDKDGSVSLQEERNKLERLRSELESVDI